MSSALYLGAADMLKLKAMLEQPDDVAHALRVLQRLSTVPITHQLEETAGVGILAFLVGLSADETMQAAVEAGAEEAKQAVTLMARIVSMWKAQLSEEQKQRDAAQTRQQRNAATLRWCRSSSGKRTRIV